jgi:hypothetical protein
VLFDGPNADQSSDDVIVGRDNAETPSPSEVRQQYSHSLITFYKHQECPS